MFPKSELHLLFISDKTSVISFESFTYITNQNKEISVHEKVVIGTHDEGLKRLKTTDVDEPQTVGSKEIKVRVHASSLNYHDLRLLMALFLRRRIVYPCLIALASLLKLVRR